MKLVSIEYVHFQGTDKEWILENSVFEEVTLIVGKTYSKMKKHVERTVEVLDYSNIYLELNKKISALEDLIKHIDEYLGS